MGKMNKAKNQRPGGLSLTEQVTDDKTVKPSSRNKIRKKEEKDDEYVDDKLSKRILDQARKQQEELEEEHGTFSGNAKRKPSQIQLGGARSKGVESDEEESEVEEENEEFYEQIDVDEDDEKALTKFMSHNPPARRTLADIIQEKLTEKKTEIQSQMTDNASVQLDQLDERLVNMYRSIKQILQKYRSGKLPKAFKVIPSLRNWEQILYLTEPETWSAAAMYQATRIFTSNLNAKMAQRFFNLVLLPRIRDDISEYKRLNFHLYQAFAVSVDSDQPAHLCCAVQFIKHLKDETLSICVASKLDKINTRRMQIQFKALRKALFKPAAFFKGILLPLCEAGNCTLREAVIISSILIKNSIPMLHSAAALLKIAEMDYNGANSIFIRSLCDKKYALPYRVVDAVVFHFVRFTSDKRELPVLWHQSMLTFVQRYKEDISSEQKEGMMELLRVHTHETITAEVRRELAHSKCRDLEVGEGPGIGMFMGD